MGGIKGVGVLDIESVCVFLCERLVGRGRKTNLTLTEGEKYRKCACVIPMPTGK